MSERPRRLRVTRERRIKPRAEALIALICVSAALPFEVVAQDEQFLESMLADVERIAGQSNSKRGDVLQAILAERGVAFALEEFEIPPRQNYPRTIGTNIVVTIGRGSGDVVIGGHYDAAWLQSGELSPGAVDNAASAVILTRVAEELSQRDRNSRIRIVLFDMEEIGLIGSRSFVDRHGAGSIAAAINLDINGYGDTLFYPDPPDRSSANVVAAMESVCGTAQFSCKAFSQYPASDYLSFRQAGIPNISLAILPADEVDRLHLALNPESRDSPRGPQPRIFSIIHTAGDRSALVQPEAMAITYRAVLALIDALDHAR